MKQGLIKGGFVGVDAEVYLSEVIALESGATFVYQGYEYSGIKLNTKTNSYTSLLKEARLIYMQMPLIFRYQSKNPKSKISVLAGPYFGYAIGGIVSESFSDGFSSIQSREKAVNWRTYENGGDDFNRKDYGFQIGVGFSIKNTRRSKVGFDIRYIQGLAKIKSSPIELYGHQNNQVYNQAIRAEIKYSFMLIE